MLWAFLSYPSGAYEPSFNGTSRQDRNMRCTFVCVLAALAAAAPWVAAVPWINTGLVGSPHFYDDLGRTRIFHGANR